MVYERHPRGGVHLGQDALNDVGLCEVDNFISASAKNALRRPYREAFRLGKGDVRRHGELLPIDHDLDQCGTWRSEGSLQRGFEVIGILNPSGMQTNRASKVGKVGIVQVRAVVHNAGCLHLQLDKGQRTVVEDDDLDWQIELTQCEQVAKHHRETAIARERDDLPIWVNGLSSDSLW